MVALDSPVKEALSASQSIKLLDLLTNRYHTGIVRETSDAGLRIEMAGAGRFQPGQRVHFALNNQPLIARQTMRRGFITRVAGGSGRLSLHLATQPESAVA